jgi:hypothetical protein
VTRDALPIPDYDHLPVGSLASHVRSLDEEGVSALLSYERQHGARVPALQVLEARLDQLRSGAQPSGGDPTSVPEAPPAPAGGSPVDPSTSGPAMNPPSHGDPTNPAQPRSTG